MPGHAFVKLSHEALISGWDRLREDARHIASLRLPPQEARTWQGTQRWLGLVWANAARRAVVEELCDHPTPGLNKAEADLAAASLRRARRNQCFRQGSVAGLVPAVVETGPLTAGGVMGVFCLATCHRPLPYVADVRVGWSE